MKEASSTEEVKKENTGVVNKYAECPCGSCKKYKFCCYRKDHVYTPPKKRVFNFMQPSSRGLPFDGYRKRTAKKQKRVVALRKQLKHRKEQ